MRKCLRDKLLNLLSLSLPFLILCSMAACGGGGGSQSNTQPPVIRYGTTSVVGTKGSAITPEALTNSGGAASSYSIQPALPAGLSLDARTGSISGTPTAVSAQTTYTVTAMNAGGSGQTTLAITVNDIAPAGLSYASNPVTYAVGAAITPDIPAWSNAGGTPTSFVGNLPSGLTVDSTTGVISGTPAQAVNATSYLITASNSGGSTSTSVTITVIPQAPYIAVQPASETVASGTSTYLAVSAGGSVLSYQWYRNGLPIGGNVLNGNVYQTPVLSSANNGDQFYVVVSDGYNRSVTSSVATLTIKGTTGTFQLTGTPTIARGCDTGTLLQNGTVLIAGGRNGNTILGEADIYDSTIGQFTPTGTLNTTRCSHTATRLPNGKVLIVGGYPSNFLPTLASAELYDPSTGQFSLTGQLQTSRAGHAATLLPNGKVLITGGSTSADGFTFSLVPTAELYDPAGGTFSATGSPLTPRSASAVLLNNGKVLLAGGAGSGATVLASSEIYDPSAGTFSTAGSMATARRFASATLLQDGRVLVAGGVDGNGNYIYSAEIFDPASGTFTPTGTLYPSSGLPTAALLPNGQVYMGTCVFYYSPLVMTQVYDPIAGVFILNAPPDPGGSAGGTTVLLPSGKLLLEGQGTSAISLTQPLPAELYLP